MEVNNIGFKINIPVLLYNKLPTAGNEITISTYMHVKEDEIVLYGFTNEDQLNLFKSLMSVSKIGPKTALSILSTFETERFLNIIETADIDSLSVVKGIGKKSAQRLILELSGKLLLPKEREISEEENVNQLFQDSLSALENLGYSKTEAIKALKKVFDKFDKDTPIQIVIKETLKNI